MTAGQVGINPMDTVATELRVAGRIVQETFGGLKRTGWNNFVILVTMASILTIFGTLFLTVMETQLFMSNIGSGLKISAYVREGNNPETLREQLENLPYVKGITVKSKEESWKEMRKSYEVDENLPNPLPDTLHVQIDSQDHLEPILETLQKVPEIEKVNYPKTVLDKISTAARFTTLIGFVATIFLGVLTFFIISNTIHLLIEARSREIEILRMMGVSNWYIRLPFLLQGALYGLLGTLIAYIPLAVTENYLGRLMQYFYFSTSGYSLSFVFTVMVLMGLIVGAGGAALSVHKYLRT
ncbi:MAG: ABC transporter permease [Vampirovibrio sp.]|nr:ABC transporter permease [Vampirovibrio sp.]